MFTRTTILILLSFQRAYITLYSKTRTFLPRQFNAHLNETNLVLYCHRRILVENRNVGMSVESNMPIFITLEKSTKNAMKKYNMNTICTIRTICIILYYNVFVLVNAHARAFCVCILCEIITEKANTKLYDCNGYFSLKCDIQFDRLRYIAITRNRILYYYVSQWDDGYI